MMKKNLLLLLLVSTSIFAQNPLARFDFLIGNWQGVETGVAGDGIGFRTYAYELNKNYIVEHNQSTFPISKNRPKGEVHRDFGVMSYNSNNSSIVFRQFHVEGFTNIFMFDKKLSSENKFVFVTREIENNPGNWKARSTLNKISETEFTDTFEIAKDGKNYTMFIKNHWHKVN